MVCAWSTRWDALVLLIASLRTVCESRSGVMMDVVPRFSSSSLTYLPVSCQLLGADSASFFLREAGQEVMRNGSLQTRSETLFLHQPSGPAPLLSINCSYGNLTADTLVPPDILQGALTPTSTLLTHTAHLTQGWKVRAHLVTTAIRADRPQAHLLFYLTGRRWDDLDPAAELLPCVRVVGIRDHGEGSVSAACRLEGSLGMCVTRLDVPQSWFTPPPPRRRSQEPPLPTMELHYSLSLADEQGGDCRAQGRGQEVEVQRIGTLTLGSVDSKAEGKKLRLDRNIQIVAPASPVKQGQVVGFQILLDTTATTEQFTLRAQFGEGINFVTVKPSTPALWEIKQEVAPGSSSLSMFCQRKSSLANERVEGSVYEVMWVDFEMDNFITLQASQAVRWRIEYPSTGETAEAITVVYVSQRDVLGIVPLAEDTEILNTAILTGQRVSLPVKVVTVEQDGTVREIDDPVSCRSTDEDVLKVSPACDEVLVNGKEMRGRVSLQVNFTYLYLKPTRDSEDDEDDERKGKGCALQYQYALVRVLTHFVAEPADPGGDLVHMLGSDWSADITELVLEFLKVEDPRIARLIDGRVLMGRDLGITTIQVRLSSILTSLALLFGVRCEASLIRLRKSSSFRPDHTGNSHLSVLGVQLVGSLSLSLQASATHTKALYISATAQDLLHTPKQEAVISAWIQYSDGSVTPLDVYDPKDFTLTATSQDERVVSIYQDHPQQWPVVVAEGEGQGPLVKVEMVISETCQKSKRKSVLVQGFGSVQVKFGQNDLGQKTRTMEEGGGDGGMDNSTSEQRQKVVDQDKNTSPDGWKYTEREEGAPRKVTTTTKSSVTSRNQGRKQAEGPKNSPGDYSIPAQVELPGGSTSDLSHNPRRLSDLEIGMYALLGVFCLAILVFLINCVSFAFRYRHKQLPVLEQGNMNHAHDWVWLGNDLGNDLMDRHGDRHVGVLGPADECTTAIDRNEGCEESKYLLNGGGAQKGGSAHSQVLPRTMPDPSCGKTEPLNNSPSASKRKRVKFTSFATVLPDEGGPYTNSVLIGNEDDIKWVCQDMDLGPSAELRTYMERLQDNL
ncbi:transmembrane protein 132D [Astyanax mexicanus]|uniref:Transmembrane protein 132D n=1 Tax=Astyanax mexicanus TaxID=7994 RepID=A0A8T2KTL6_ASTMX|nr:transmembrane protein 132D [Astyanax mexicanus]